MIKVNLASSIAKNSAGQTTDDALFLSQDDIQKQALKRLFLIAMFPAALFVYEKQIIPDLKRQNITLTNELNELTAENSASADLVEKIKKLNETKAVFDKRLQAIEQLSANRYKEVKILDFLQTTIPETVWFRSLEFTGDKISLLALAMSDADVSKFLEDLNRSGDIKEVKLNRSTDEKIDDNIIKRFEVDLVFENSSIAGAQR